MSREPLHGKWEGVGGADKVGRSAEARRWSNATVFGPEGVTESGALWADERTRWEGVGGADKVGRSECLKSRDRRSDVEAGLGSNVEAQRCEEAVSQNLDW